MPNVTTQHKMFVPRRRRIGGGGAAVNILPPITNVVTGDYTDTAIEEVEVHYPTPADPSRTAYFMFWSIRGSADGEYTQGDPALLAHPNGGPLEATAWYSLGLGSGGGNGRTELETDAFLVDQDAFVDPTPIANVAPADAWDHSDVDEFVFTDTEASNVEALDSVGGHANEHFERWYAFEGGAAPTSDHGLHVPQDDDGIAIATYRIPPAVKPPVVGKSGEIFGTIVGGVAHDGGGGIIVNGVYHPIGPWNPLLAGIALLETARGLRPAARAQIQRETLRAMAAEIGHMEQALR